MHRQYLFLQLLGSAAVVEGIWDASELSFQLRDLGTEQNDVSFGRDLLVLLEAMATPHAGGCLSLIGRDAKWVFQNCGVIDAVKLHGLRLRISGDIQSLRRSAGGHKDRCENTEAEKSQRFHGTAL